MGAHRLRGIAFGLAPVVLVLALLNVLLSAVFGLAASSVVDAELVDPDARFDIASRASEVMQLNRQAGQAGGALTVVVGLSTAREALSPSVFEANSPPGQHLLNLAYAGGSFEDMLAYYGPVLTTLSGVHQVVLAVHPSWLAGRPVREAPATMAQVLQAARPHTPRRLMGALYTWADAHAWLTANRQGMHYLLRGALLSLRERWLRAAGIAPAAWRQDGSTSAWEVRQLYRADKAEPAVLLAQMHYWAGAGWFDPASFRADGRQAQAWMQLLDRALASGACLSVVLMPESSALRARMPVQAEQALLSIQARVAHRTRMIDLRHSMPEDRFHDHAHLNAKGRGEFSARLAGLLATVPPTCPVSDGH